MSLPCTKIDAHLHLRFEDMTSQGSQCSHKEMTPYFGELNIAKGILMSAGELLTKCAANEENMEIVKADPEHYAWVCNPEPINPDTVYDALKYYKEKGAVGVGELTCNLPLTHPTLRALFDAAGKLGMPVTLHMSSAVGYSYGVVDEPKLPFLEQTLKDFPDTIFIGHSACFWCEMSADSPADMRERNRYPSGPVLPGGKIPELLEKYPNLYCDLSATSGGQAILRDEAHGLRFLERFSDRLLYATDLCQVGSVYPLGDWLDKKFLSGELSENTYRKVCRENAEKLYSI